MRIFGSALKYLSAIFVLCALSNTSALAQATISDAHVLATDIEGIPSGTLNSRYVFRATVTFGDVGPANLPGRNTPVALYIDPFNVDEPERSGARLILDMQPDPTPNRQPNGWFVVVNGEQILQGIHRWAVVARNNSTGGVLMNGMNASPKPAGTVHVYPNQIFEIIPVDENYRDDKRAIPGQLGNGLRVNPEESSAPNDGGSAHFYTWRVRVRNVPSPGGLPGGLPPQFAFRRNAYEWRDTRTSVDIFNPSGYNSGVILVLVDPSGNLHLCPMEIDPDAPGQEGLHATTYPVEDTGAGLLYRPVGGAVWRASQGVFYRYRMLPTQYFSVMGVFTGEPPYNAFGGPTQPDQLPAIMIGGGVHSRNFSSLPAEIIGRPFENQYVSFAGPGLVGPFPFGTNTAGRSGQWRYYYMVTADLRPPQRPGFPSNFSYPGGYDALIGNDPQAYLFNIDNDWGQPYNHPFVTPILSDGGWTDDLPENYGSGSSGPARRSRPTTKTRVRFQVRVTKADNLPLPANAVRVVIDNVPYTMLPAPGTTDNDFPNGRVYYFDTQFPTSPGPHYTYFEVDDGIHRAIWPRRDTAVNGTGDTRYPDLQALLPDYSPTFTNPVLFWGIAVGKNYLAEPYVNNRPVLSNPSVSPASGADTQPFTYEITYTDADGDEPLDAVVVIDGQAHNMTAVDNTPVTQGRRYRFILTRIVPTPDGKHNYYFKFRDNWNRLAQYQISRLRREYGEWTTFPSGDDEGNPSSVIPGPVIITNKKPELLDSQVFASDAARTSATLFDFVVRYKDPENDPPTTIRLHISNDDGATYDSGTAMVPAEASTNYAAGVQFHLPQRIRLPYNATNDPAAPPFKYRFKFVASDAAHQGDNTTLVHVGTRETALADGTAATLVPVDGSNTIYEDRPTTPSPTVGATRRWLDPPSGTLFVWKGQTLLTLGTDYTLDAVNGRIVLTSPNTTNEPIRASYFYEEREGPIINPNRPPTLTPPNPTPGDNNYGTIEPVAGNPFQWRYAIIYTDPDNQPPAGAGVEVVIDTNIRVQLTMDPDTPTPIDYRRGVKFTGTTTLQVGAHTYHFEATDGAALARYPDSGELSGPNVVDIGNLQNPLIQPFPKGKSNDEYLFTVTYRNAQGVAPAFPLEVRIFSTDGLTRTDITLDPIDPIGPNEYMNGVRYQTSVRAPNPPLTEGSHDVTFAFKGQAQPGTPTQTLIVNSPPILSGQGVSPSTQSRAGDLSFTVNYRDINGDSPTAPGASIVLIIDGTPRNETPTSNPANPTADDFKSAAGVTYTWVIAASTLTEGAHTFQITANDGTESTSTPTGNFTVTAAGTPTLTAPAGGTLNPTSGSTATIYSYSVQYAHPDGVLPTSIKLFIDGNEYTASPPTLNPANPTVDQIRSGVVYTWQTPTGFFQPGTHNYRFQAADRLTTVNLPAMGTFSGPTVSLPPTLSAPTVFKVGTPTPPVVDNNNALQPPVVGNAQTQLIFRVTYTAPSGQAPGPGGYVRAVVTGDPASPIAMQPKAGDPLNYAQGVVYESAPVRLSPGQKTFHFEANDGRDTIRLPEGTAEITGLTIHNLPVLAYPNPGDPSTNEGSLTPITGTTVTTFIYRVIYKHADNLPPTSVRVVIDGTPQPMTKITPGTDYVTGILYEYQTQFSSGTTHTYRFEAQDGIDSYIARLPVDGSNRQGPTIDIPTFQITAFTPSPGILGAEMTITGRLIVAQPAARDIAIQLVRPDGTGQLGSTRTATDGSFTFKFTPDQTGNWKIILSWGGQPGVYNPATAEFPFTVAGITIPLAAGEIDMVSSPLIPTTPDPAITFSPTTPPPGSQPVPVTALNIIRWDPLLGSTGGYRSLNDDPNFGGILPARSYWMRPDQSVVLNPRGRLTAQNQPYTLGLVPGWNMIASVYLEDIDWADVQVRFQGQVLDIADASNIVRPTAWTYDKSIRNYRSVPINGGVLSKFRGYWVRALQACEITLNPRGLRTGRVTRSAEPAKAENKIQIIARIGNMMDVENFAPLAGFKPGDPVDSEKPPYIGDFVTVRFVPTNTAELPEDTRAAAAGQGITLFDVETNQKNADVTLVFPTLGALARKTEATLIDLATGTRRSLSTSSGYTYNTGENGLKRRFALLTTPQTASTRLIISDLRQTTDPQNRAAGMTFTYNISGAANVKAQIINAGGRVIRDITQTRAVTRGVNSLLWDGKDNRGIAVPAGAYTLRLSAVDNEGRAANAVLQVIVVR